MRLKTLLPLSVVCSLLACGDKENDAVGESDGATGTTGATGDDSDSTAAGAPFEPYEARGITIVRVEANPGVAVPIGLDGGAVGGEGRNAYIPPRRDTLIRAFVEVEQGWAPRPIEGRLTLTLPDGREEVLSGIFEIGGATAAAQIGSGPYFGVDAEWMAPGLKYSLSLWETVEGYREAPMIAPRLPADGSSAPVGVEDAYLNMAVVLVPIAYSYGSCEATVDGEALRRPFGDALFQQNPLESLDLTIHAPYPVTYDMGTYSGINKLVNEMSQLRAEEGAAPHVYYYGVFDNCGRCIGSGDGPSGGCIAGLAASITGEEKSNAWARAAAGQLSDGAAQTFVHEVGHTQGRQHVYCAGAGVQSQGNDPTYPYPDGRINVWGFGVRDLGLRHPTVNSDYMSYCGNAWASDWQWNKTYTRIKTLSGWELEGGEAPAGDGLLIGALAPDGSQEWWTAPGTLAATEPRSATHSLRFEAAGEVIEEAAQISVRPDYPTLMVVAPLPAEFDATRRIELLAPEGAREIVIAPTKLLHRGDRVRGR